LGLKECSESAFDADPDSAFLFDADPDQDSTFHSDADPDPTFHLIRIRILPLTFPQIWTFNAPI
jgi:hypothetical protein